MVTDPDPRESLARRCITAGIKAARPETVIRKTVSVEDNILQIENTKFNLAEYSSVVIIGGGNAASQVAAELEALLQRRISGGVIVTDDDAETTHVEVLSGNHPVPNKRGVDSTQRLVQAANSVDENTLVLAIITGGASALLTKPVEGISLSDLQKTTEGLLASGATIHEMNSVRKHLSEVKGGNLAKHLFPARVATLLFSDVIGDDPSVIGSGPTVPDHSTYTDALNVLSNYEVDAPETVYEYIEQGATGKHEETPGANNSVFERVSTHVLANNRTAINAAADIVKNTAYTPLVLSTTIRGEAREAAKTHAAIAEEISKRGDPIKPPCVVLSGGECTVTLQGDGKGGPNLEFALSGALELPTEVTLCAVDTDGIDGTTDVAGAVVESETVTDQNTARKALRTNNVFPYLADHDALITTGPTGTNVNDLRVVVID